MPNGKVVVNTDKTPSELGKMSKRSGLQWYTVNATRIALDVLGRPIFNTPMLGALLKAESLASMNSVAEAIKERFPARIADSNLEAVRLAHEKVTST